MIVALLIAAATATASDDCPGVGRQIDGPISTEAPIFDLATQSQVGKITLVKGQVAPVLTIERCAGRYFVSHLDGKFVVVPRKSVSYQGSITKASSICVDNAGGAAADKQRIAGTHAADPLYCDKSGAGK